MSRARLLGANRTASEGIRSGVPGEYFADGLDPEVRTLWKLHQKLANAGCEVVPISLPLLSMPIPNLLRLSPLLKLLLISRDTTGCLRIRSPESATLSAMYRRSRDEGFGPEVKRRNHARTYPLSAVTTTLII